MSPLTQGRGLKYSIPEYYFIPFLVAPHAGAWIEINRKKVKSLKAGASPLTQGRGLKYNGKHRTQTERNVAPHAGAWIEILMPMKTVGWRYVAPHAGAWIEIGKG